MTLVHVGGHAAARNSGRWERIGPVAHVPRFARATPGDNGRSSGSGSRRLAFPPASLRGPGSGIGEPGVAVGFPRADPLRRRVRGGFSPPSLFQVRPEPNTPPKRCSSRASPSVRPGAPAPLGHHDRQGVYREPPVPPIRTEGVGEASAFSLTRGSAGATFDLSVRTGPPPPAEGRAQRRVPPRPRRSGLRGAPAAVVFPSPIRHSGSPCRLATPFHTAFWSSCR